MTLSTTLPDSVFGTATTDSSTPNGNTNTSNSSDDDDPLPTPDIVVENVICKDANDNRLTEITKDTKPFTVEIIFADYGMINTNSRDYNESDLQVFMTSAAGIIPTGSTRGQLWETTSLASDNAPRYRAVFNNLTFDGTANTITFRTQYLSDDGDSLKGEGTAVVHQAKTSEEDKDKLKPIKPHIIVSQYSYAEDQITAGADFTLNLTITNTSKDIPLENVIMTISPQTIDTTTAGTAATGGLTITSASNTTYIESLPVGGTLNHSIDLRAEPNAAVGSHKVKLEFKFQYVDSVNETREDGTDEENIAIPVTQIDRFSVDPLTEIPEILMAGEDGYLTVNFVNRGKSTTSNITGTLKGNMSNNGASQYFGNLEAGKPGSLDFDIISYEPGEIQGEILIEYEDENENTHEISMPFTIMVETMYIPPDDNGGMVDPGMMEPQGPALLNIILCCVGGVLIAVPLGLYIFKRVKVKGIEALDEDF